MLLGHYYGPAPKNADIGVTMIADRYSAAVCSGCQHDESEHQPGLGCWGKPERIRTDGPTPGCRCKGFVQL